MRAISRLVAALAFLDLTKVTGFAPAPSTTRWRSRPCSSARLALSSSKWDNLVDDEDEGPPVPPDMKYVPRNVIRQHQNFVDIREAGGEEMTNDIYVREPGSQVFWFSDVSLEDAVARQWPLIEKHAANLRPIELFPHRGHLEIWTAPGDSELDVANKLPSLVFTKMNREGNSKGIKSNMIGFQGEVYQKDEQGFRTWRTNDGAPIKPEIIPDGGTRVPSDEEMAKLEKQLEGQDINALYEEQQRREGNDVSP